jgi:putative phosphoribosyl transferase
METATIQSAEQFVSIPAAGAIVQGILGLPTGARGVVLFAHGSGSGRHSPRNNFVARVLQKAGLATLLLDLLEEREATDRRNVFDIDLLADRVLTATQWLRETPETRPLRVGYFGASTGAGAALQAAARLPSAVDAVVSRGGRPDMAADYLPRVQAPTLLIVGGYDVPVIEMNQEALLRLRCVKELVIVPGATHLFEEAGTLEEVARLACNWFQRYLGAEQPAAPRWEEPMGPPAWARRGEEPWTRDGVW